MAKPIFTWFPDEGANESAKPDVNVVKFGDGYEQRSPNGINYERAGWSLTFTGNIATASEIRSFLRTQGATTSFQWTNPFGEIGVYVCREWGVKKISPSILQLTATFDRVYES